MILNLVQVENTVKTSLRTDHVTIPNGALPHARYPVCKSPQYSVTMWNSGVSNPQNSIYIYYSPLAGQILLRDALSIRIDLLARRIWPKPQRIHYNRLREYNPIEKTRKMSKIPKLAKPEPRAHVSKFRNFYINTTLISPRVYTYQIHKNRSLFDPSNHHLILLSFKP